MGIYKKKKRKAKEPKKAFSNRHGSPGKSNGLELKYHKGHQETRECERRGGMDQRTLVRRRQPFEDGAEKKPAATLGKKKKKTTDDSQKKNKVGGVKFGQKA